MACCAWLRQTTIFLLIPCLLHMDGCRRGVLWWWLGGLEVTTEVWICVQESNLFLTIMVAARQTMDGLVGSQWRYCSGKARGSNWSGKAKDSNKIPAGRSRQSRKQRIVIGATLQNGRKWRSRPDKMRWNYPANNDTNTAASCVRRPQDQPRR